MASGVVFQNRFYCRRCIMCLYSKTLRLAGGILYTKRPHAWTDGTSCTHPIAPALSCSSSSSPSPSDRDVLPFPVKPKFRGKASVLSIINLQWKHTWCIIATCMVTAESLVDCKHVTRGKVLQWNFITLFIKVKPKRSHT